MMDFKEYQKQAARTDTFGGGEHKLSEAAFVNKLLGLSSETGEVADKFKKIIRDKNGEINDEDKKGILKELGDVLWYLAMLAEYLGSSIEEVAEMNVSKLASRYERDEIHGSGDDR
jgi:NTP pyrophosphatase (non-canonical NTP hydrolase)